MTVAVHSIITGAHIPQFMLFIYLNDNTLLYFCVHRPGLQVFFQLTLSVIRTLVTISYALLISHCLLLCFEDCHFNMCLAACSLYDCENRKI
jgi:hypothetical protein